ncbi:aldehyde dehydrogenase [Fusarium tjaetaba]|uniref:Aldehyde dehydrogenase n=1 Tax=Fusarium tjaetaba TaxID=1567544 RepID=A0A8H5VXM8_9HYPO|nr:aldehyde dehydrogenase [Fusarium tjaetaba]KAF5638240.1 aldehyde dehydrogenase [Fusarium tjaetaba]
MEVLLHAATAVRTALAYESETSDSGLDSTSLWLTRQAVIPPSLWSTTGGKSPLIVFEDSNLDLAAQWAHLGFTSMILKYPVGQPFEEKTYLGPLVSKAHFHRMREYVSLGKEEGAKDILDGYMPSRFKKGYFVSPSIFVDVKPSMRIYQEETFGPCAVVLKFKDEDEAVRLANDSMYGLGSALSTENISKAHNVARRIEAGMVWVNSNNYSDFRVPFG